MGLMRRRIAYEQQLTDEKNARDAKDQTLDQKNVAQDQADANNAVGDAQEKLERVNADVTQKAAQDTNTANDQANAQLDAQEKSERLAADVKQASDLALNSAGDAADKSAQTVRDGGQDTTVATLAARVALLEGKKSRDVRVQTSGEGIYIWTFTPPFPVGVIPVVSGLVEAPKGSTVPYDIQTDGPVSNVSVTIKVIKAASANIPVIGALPVPLFAVPGAVWVHLTAKEPTS